MRALNRIGILFLLAAVGLLPLTARAEVDRERAQGKSADADARATAAKNAVAADCEQGIATVQLDVNNVRADLYNTGQLFYPAGPGYEVPKGSGNHAVFASGLWIGGLADGELRMAAATYAQFGADYEFFPGPLNDDGSVPNPNDCRAFDAMFKVSRADLVAYDQTGVATNDMLNWPYQLGAPVVDGDGNASNYDLAAGDRPELIGDQTIWWVMNDAAGDHLSTSTAAIGLEVQGTAFAFATGDALNNTTFYKYKLIYKPSDGSTLEDVWLGLWSDPDLGNFGDDFVGSDTTLGLGFVYNGDPLDEGAGGYGAPPAAGYDFFQGPLVNTDGIDNDGDGEIDEEDERLQMTRFVYYNNDNSVTGTPQDAEDFYGYLRGVWTDNSSMTLGGDGYGGTIPVNFMFPGEPPAFWSEDNTDGAGARNIPADRRFLMSTGPFTMEPGDEQEIVFGIIWSQTADRIGSIRQLKADDVLAQGAFDFNFNLPPAPDAPVLGAAELDETIVLSWENPVTSNNYLNQYDLTSPFIVDESGEDTTYTFEGYKIYQYTSLSQAPEDGLVIKTIDVPGNTVTTIVDNAIDPNTGAPIRRVVAAGSDTTSMRNFFVVDRDYVTDTPLRNGTEYVFGIQTYAYNPFSDPQIRQSQIQRVTVIPSRVPARAGGTELRSNVGTEMIAERTAGIGEGRITARVVDPTRVTGGTYSARFYEVDVNDSTSVLTYDLVNEETGATLVDGTALARRLGTAPPFGDDLLVVEGLSFSISGPPPGFTSFQVVANAAGPLDPPDQGAFAFNNNGFPFLFNDFDDNGDGQVDEPGEVDRPSARQQVGDGMWGIQQGADETHATYDDFVALATRSGVRWPVIIPNNFEVRFTERGGKALIPAAFGFPENVVIDVPFELWNVGTSPGTDDDVRYFPYLFDNDFSDPVGGQRFSLATQAGIDSTFGAGAISADHAVSGGADDPYTDLIYWVIPEDETAGESGYDALVQLIESDPAGYGFLDGTNDRSIERMVFVNWNGGDVATGSYNQDMIETGTIFRIITAKPIVAGDVYMLDSEEFAPIQGDVAAAREALNIIGIVPNPYKGASEYDRTTEFEDEARLINMPEQATVRIFSLDGTLVRTLRKNSPDNILRWNLQTEDGLPIASGIYIIHVEVPGVGERVIKFGVVLDKIHLDVF